jgi:hypothetical protein
MKKRKGIKRGEGHNGLINRRNKPSIYIDTNPSPRYFTQKRATEYRVTGWVRNASGGKVGTYLPII